MFKYGSDIFVAYSFNYTMCDSRTNYKPANDEKYTKLDTINEMGTSKETPAKCIWDEKA